ncbi:MAG: amino acid kinase [Sulfurifustis sp.]
MSRTTPLGALSSRGKRAPLSARTMWVVKLGGSLAGGQTLPRWLQMLATHGRGRAVIVPGGGPFADQVRAMQARWRFDDTAAHHMALLAMEQYALMLRALRPELAPAVTVPDVRRVVERGGVPLWLPASLALAECPLPQSWDTTSDSLAAWFATKLDASHLVLVKSISLRDRAASARSLQRDGIVDRLFPEVIARSAFTTIVLGPSDASRLRALFSGEDDDLAVAR